jgi:hypothetical protein
MQQNGVVTSHPVPEEMPRIRITAAEIVEVKKAHILKNLLYSYEEAGQVLGKSVRVIQELVKDGKLIAADEAAAKGRKMSCAGKVTAESLERYRNSILVSPDFWKK